MVIVRPDSGGGDQDNGNGNDPVQHTERPRPPWRDLGNLRGRGPQPEPVIRKPAPSMSMPGPQVVPAAGTSRRSGSVMGETVRRARTDSDARRKSTP